MRARGAACALQLGVPAAGESDTRRGLNREEKQAAQQRSHTQKTGEDLYIRSKSHSSPRQPASGTLLSPLYGLPAKLLGPDLDTDLALLISNQLI